jgi:6-hydroxymethylpterin diphosphokinase MptE-like
MTSLIKQAVKKLERLGKYIKYFDDQDFREWLFNHHDHLEKFKDIHRGEDCFIIGNGPSLNKMDLTLLNNHYTFGLNKIFLIFDRVDLNLDYYVASNPYIIKQSVTEIESLNCPSFIGFNPQGMKSSIRDLDHIYFILAGSSLISFQRDLKQPIWTGRTVTYVALQIAYYMGFENVFLVGVDHNFKCKGDPSEKQVLQGEDLNHFDPNYFSGQEWQLPDYEGIELSFGMAKYCYERHDRKIYDATVDGKLEIFPKISFEQALTICKKKAVFKK